MQTALIGMALLCASSCTQVFEEEEEELVLSKVGCFVWLAGVTLLISVLSDFIMDAITGAHDVLFVTMLQHNKPAR
jgi:hypothetical protein